MKTKFLILAFACLTSCSILAQKVDIDYNKKTGMVLADKVPIFKVIETRSASTGGTDIEIQNFEGEELCFLALKNFSDPSRRNQNNPKGLVWYYKVTFNDSLKRVAEIGHDFFKGTLLTMHNSKVFINGKIDYKALDKFVERNCCEFTEWKARLSR